MSYDARIYDYKYNHKEILAYIHIQIREVL